MKTKQSSEEEWVDEAERSLSLSLSRRRREETTKSRASETDSESLREREREGFYCNNGLLRLWGFGFGNTKRFYDPVGR